MPRDAKLGLVVGVGLVLSIALTFFRKEPATATGPADLPSATAAQNTQSARTVKPAPPSPPAQEPAPEPPPIEPPPPLSPTEPQ